MKGNTLFEQQINYRVEQAKERGDTQLTTILMQYMNLRKHFSNLIDEVLGEDYYNMSCDVYSCDAQACKDIAAAVPKSLIEEIFGKRRNKRVKEL